MVDVRWRRACWVWWRTQNLELLRGPNWDCDASLEVVQASSLVCSLRQRVQVPRTLVSRKTGSSHIVAFPDS